jgi:hypothetical protein
MDHSPLSDALGWCLALFLPAFVMLGPIRRDRRVAQCYLLTVLVHIVAAAVYVYMPGILPARGDTHAFHKYAVLSHLEPQWSFNIGSVLFQNALAYVYSWVGPSFFFASVLSIYAYAFSVLILAKFMEMLEIEHSRGLVILLFGALPTAVLYGTVPMREPYQVLFFMLACYGMVRFRITNQPLHLMAAMLSALLMGLLHKGLILYAPFLIMIMLFVRVDRGPQRLRSSRTRLYFHRGAAIALAIGFVAGMSSAVHELEGVHGTEVLTAATVDGLINYTADARSGDGAGDGGSTGRTSYGIQLDTTSWFTFLHSLSLIFLFYMFTPFPWQVSNFLDIYAFGEVILRVITLVAIFRMWRRGGPVHPQLVTLLMIVYLSMAFLWAAGTTNYGTATRHHMVHQWILLMLGVPALLRTAPSLVRGAFRAQAAEVLSLPAQQGARLMATGRALRAAVPISAHPPRLREGTCELKRLPTGRGAIRMLSGGLRQVRGLGRS